MTESYVYCVNFERVKDRIDYVAYNPEKIKFFNKLKGIGGESLSNLDGIEVIEEKAETIEPKQFPETSFKYLGLENIESDTGIAHFQDMLGKELYSKARLFKNGDLVFSRLRPYL